MNKIVRKDYLSDRVVRIEVEAPMIAHAHKPGNFIIYRIGNTGERVPLTIVESNTKTGTITLVVQRVGVSSAKLCSLNVGDYITDLLGPLGKATELSYKGTILGLGGGVGTAPLVPIIKGFKEMGNKVISVIAGRTKELVILEKEVRQWSDEVIIMTDDGSYGEKGLITTGAEKIILREKIDECITVGPAIMMKFCAQLTKKYNIPTQCSLNAIMVDGTGMCGACRVTVEGETKFTCVDGPEFNAFDVNFDELMMRLSGYKAEELEANQRFNF